MSTPTDAAERKALPIARGCLDYFPDALLAVAELSRIGNEQHNPGEPMHWAKDKSTDHADSLVRHLIDRGKFDGDGVRHTTKVAWRALALLQTEIEEESEELRETVEDINRVFAGPTRDLWPDASYVQDVACHVSGVNYDTVMTHRGQGPWGIEERPHAHDPETGNEILVEF